MKKLVICFIAVLFISLMGCSNNSVESKTTPETNSLSVKTTQSTDTPKTGSSSIEYYFPRGGQPPEPVLVNIINSSKKSLDIAIYSFTDTKIASAIVSAKKRGVVVRVISDKECSAESSQKKVLKLLENANIPIKINKHSGLMHLKVTIADQSIATTGSFNYTKAAENENDEVFVVLRDVNAAKTFESQFLRMWNDSKGFVNYS